MKSAPPIAPPGWPDFAFSTIEAARTRMLSAARFITALSFISQKSFDYQFHGGFQRSPCPFRRQHKAAPTVGRTCKFKHFSQFRRQKMTSLTNFYFNFQSPDLVFLALDAVGMLVQYVLFGRFRSAGYIHPDVAFSFLDAVRMFCSEGAVRKAVFIRMWPVVLS